jgi:hypothetical protein
MGPPRFIYNSYSLYSVERDGGVARARVAAGCGVARRGPAAAPTGNVRARFRLALHA